jgi:hypothetical protein
VYVIEGGQGQGQRLTAREFFGFKVRCANRSVSQSVDGFGGLIALIYLWLRLTVLNHHHQHSTAFSPDGATAYFADSPSHEIWAFDYDSATGRIQADSQRVFANVPGPGVSSCTHKIKWSEVDWR